MTALDHLVRPDVPTTGWATAQGRRRVSADAATARTATGRFAVAVADGVGDTPAAAQAARLAVAVAADEAWGADAAGAPPAVRHALADTAPTVPVSRLPHQATAAVAPPDAGAGDTTYAVAAGDRDGWCVVWVGDCRAYFMPQTPGATALPLTADHTIGQYLRERGVRAAPRLDRVVTTTARKGVPGWAAGPPGPGRLVLVTNGVHHLLDAGAIARTAGAAADPAEAARLLVAAALDAGGTDNAAAAVADLH
ncbi:protein phosphatase 2C domain-containing protein [Actinosynnema sp. NPDC050436]|uniref:protein phosphatase 2C domain-containing protein n=1 Tax=Actinosynnema sp. NPDC050436 TaxID=3155659 RepID=UPI0033FBDF00